MYTTHQLTWVILLCFHRLKRVYFSAACRCSEIRVAGDAEKQQHGRCGCCFRRALATNARAKHDGCVVFPREKASEVEKKVCMKKLFARCMQFAASCSQPINFLRPTCDAPPRHDWLGDGRGVVGARQRHKICKWPQQNGPHAQVVLCWFTTRTK